MSKFKSTVEHLAENGIRSTLSKALFQLQERRYEHRIGIDTAHEVSLESLNIDAPDSIRYSPISYAALYKAMDSVSTEYLSGSFLDFGAGKGRAVCVASRYPFQQIIGIEFSEQLSQLATNNIQRIKTPKACTDISIQTCDATEFPIPADATVMHFYNPFRADTLDSVASNIKASIDQHPRDVLVLFANPDDFERLLSETRIFEKSQVQLIQEFIWPHAESDDGLGNCYRLYLISAES